ncbi:hypothetical protein GKS11_01470 [Streptococcus uberis]|uniref:hypothetical protein n=1 Tax=Streptococcus uberis TaxID=1349 RepID=UPI0012B50CBA|nr:hypothetical protein [Streptococcus uberis]MTC88040.1 hypothetical protein [Streptococcus uberis]
MSLKANGYYNPETKSTHISVRDTDPTKSVFFDAMVSGVVPEEEMLEKAMEWFGFNYIDGFADRLINTKITELDNTVVTAKSTMEQLKVDFSQSIEKTTDEMNEKIDKAVVELTELVTSTLMTLSPQDPSGTV